MAFTDPTTLVRLDVSSVAFAAGAIIPKDHTCDGANRSPPLSWGRVPDATRAFVIIADDPDAPGMTWVHWLAWDIPGTARGLPEGVSPTEPTFPQGTNDFRERGYGGPCPPRGHGAHRYVFRLFALDRMLGIPPGAVRHDVEAAMRGHVVGMGELMGKYQRR